MVSNQHKPINGKPGESAPQVDESKSTTPGMSADLKEFLEYERRSNREADEAARRDPTLRLAMVELVTDLGDLIENAAAQLAHQKGSSSKLEADRAADLIVRQLTEFLAQGYFPRNEADNVILQGYQVDAEHAQDFFEVGIPVTGGQPFAIEAEVQS